MPTTPESIDQRLVRALAHPLRVRILEVLTDRVASPNALSEQLDVGLSHVAYHTRALEKCGCLELIDTAQRRGATEHFYKAPPGSFVGSRVWRGVPHSIRGGVSAAWIQTFMDKFVAALEAGTIDGRDDTSLNWMPLLLDLHAWLEVTAIMEQTTDLVLEKAKGRREAISAIVAVANFETAGSRQV
jgi:DNA-binding transcriptional ArsR family regulator